MINIISTIIIIIIIVLIIIIVTSRPCRNPASVGHRRKRAATHV